jgi:uncharacterized protein YkwD
MRYLILLLSILVLSTNASQAQKKKGARTKKPIQSEQAMCQEIHRLINLKRSIYNLPPLHLDDSLSRMATQHSCRMATGAIPVSHQDFNDREVDIRERWKDAGPVGENVTNAADAEEAVDLWWTSQGHQDNIIGVWQETGIGVAHDSDGLWYCTQIFVQR